MDEELIDSCLEQLEVAWQALSRRIHGELRHQIAEGITLSQFFLLREIAHRGRVTVSEVAAGLGVTLSAVTALAEKLSRAGLITRSRDPADRRVVWLELTGKGAEMLEICREGRNRVLRRYLGRLPPEDLERLVNIYRRLVSAVEAEEGPGGERQGG